MEGQVGGGKGIFGSNIVVIGSEDYDGVFCKAQFIQFCQYFFNCFIYGFYQFGVDGIVLYLLDGQEVAYFISVWCDVLLFSFCVVFCLFFFCGLYGGVDGVKGQKSEERFISSIGMMVVYEGNSFVCEVYGEIFIIFLVVKVRIGLG